MNTYADKNQKNKRQSAANKVAQQRRSTRSAFHLADNRRNVTVQLQPVTQRNWKHWAGGALVGAAGALIGGAALPVLAGAAVAGGIAGGIAGHFFGGARQQPYRFGDNVRVSYTNWSEDQASNIQIPSRGGVEVRARHNRGAPYLTRSGVGDKYSNFIPATVGGEDEQLVATDLLDNTNRAIKTDTQKENAAMMEAVVGLAEEWRKHGAAWVYRAILRGVKAGKWTMSQVPKLFAFVKSANSGRRQVARIQDVKSGRLPPHALVGEEQDIMGYGSDIDDDGFESDDDVRSRHGMKGRRLFSTKYDPKDE